MVLIFIALLLTPVIEIALFIKIGEIIGVWATMGAVILAALVGFLLLQAQGAGLMAQARKSLAQGEMPVKEVVHGVFLVVAAVLFITPGFFTDALGLLLCIPPLRLLLGRAILRRVRKRIDVHVARRRGDFRTPGDRDSRDDGANR